MKTTTFSSEQILPSPIVVPFIYLNLNRINFQQNAEFKRLFKGGLYHDKDKHATFYIKKLVCTSLS